MKLAGILLSAALTLVLAIPMAMAQVTRVETTTVSTPAFTLPASGSYIVVDPGTGKVFADYTPTLKIPAGYYVAERSSGRLVATVDASGSLVALTATPAPNVLAEIEQRTAELQQQLADAVTRNVVTVTEVAPIRTALEKVVSEQVVLKQSPMVSFAQVAPLAYRVNVISSQVPTILKTTTAYTPILGDRIIVEGGQVVFATTDYAARRALLDQRIQAEYDAGRLTNSQVKDLRNDLIRISNLELKRKKDGSYSTSTMKSIERRFNDISSDLSEDIADTSKRRARIGLKVD